MIKESFTDQFHKNTFILIKILLFQELKLSFLSHLFNRCNHCPQLPQNHPGILGFLVWAFLFPVSFFTCKFPHIWSVPLQSALFSHPPSAWNLAFLLLRSLWIWKTLTLFVCQAFWFLWLFEADHHVNTSLILSFWSFSCLLFSYRFLRRFSRDFDWFNHLHFMLSVGCIFCLNYFHFVLLIWNWICQWFQFLEVFPFNPSFENSLCLFHCRFPYPSLNSKLISQQIL